MILSRRPEKAFTLIELIITTAILGIISLVIVSTLASGINVFRKVQTFMSGQTEAVIALEKMERDMRNAICSRAVYFVGDKSKVTFTGIVDMDDAKERARATIGTISYFFDDADGGLIREERNYSRSLSDGGPERGRRAALAGVEDLSFKYFYFDKDADRFDWKDSWNLKEDTTEEDVKKSGLPLGVEIKLTYRDGGKEICLARKAFLPCATVAE